MSEPITFTDEHLPIEQRMTRRLYERLLELATQFEIEVLPQPEGKVLLTGRGFLGEPVCLDQTDARVRLLAEVCSILARWVSFNLWEPCEVTLQSLPAARLERYAQLYRRSRAAELRAAAKAAKLAALRPVDDSSG